MIGACWALIITFDIQLHNFAFAKVVSDGQSTHMTYELALGDKTYSSWSLRGWLLFSAFDVPVSVRSARMYSDGFKTLLSDFAPAKLFPPRG